LGPPPTVTRLPARYEPEWRSEFWAYVNGALHPGISILDVVAGRRPAIAPEVVAARRR
jgi:hypothetical protein